MAETLRRGRPRDERATQQILEVTLLHLAQYGYAGLSLDAIATEAGVTKPTLYRRWASKEDLVTAAVSEWRNRSMPKLTGNYRADMEAHLRQVGALLSQPLAVAMTAALLVHERSDPTLIDLYRERNIGPRYDALHTILTEAQRDGALNGAFDLETVIAMIMGSFYWQLIRGQTLTATWPLEIMNVIFKPEKKSKR